MQEVHGKGSFGIVVRAFDEKHQRVVAIKAMSSRFAATPPARNRHVEKGSKRRSPAQTMSGPADHETASRLGGSHSSTWQRTTRRVEAGLGVRRHAKRVVLRRNQILKTVG